LKKVSLRVEKRPLAFIQPHLCNGEKLKDGIAVA
jgi:hypothetical protein